MKKINTFLSTLLCFFIFINETKSQEFNEWVETFKIRAIESGISESTVNSVMSNAVFIPKIIEYDRYQPEFYEDTKTYIQKRTSNKKLSNGVKIFKKNHELINNVERKYDVEKELLLALMGIETNFGKYLGKMDIISSLSTLSYDKRRSEFFTNELLIILRLIDNNVIDPNILYGSWAGAFGNFQFMPSTIKNYAIDYNDNKTIELKEPEDSFASAANYLNKIGWKLNDHCFYKINLSDNIPINLLNTSAKKIKHKKKYKFYKEYINNYNGPLISNDEIVAIITPDKDIIPENQTLHPAYIVFSNYEIILSWNRSLRFALAVCTLKEKFVNAL
tara:strand:- start:648 stop:1646 length:999 start_codon:yes stop_codon:yes gene_type:complete